AFLLAHRRTRHLVDHVGRALLARAGIHCVERLVAAAHRLLAVEERDTDSLTALAVDKHQHLGALEPRRWAAGIELGANHADRLIDVGGIALECRYACVHVSSFESRRKEASLRRFGP